MDFRTILQHLGFMLTQQHHEIGGVLMEITKTLLINAACLLIPPVVVVLLLQHFFPRKIRWSAGVVALVDLVIFWTDIFYYESVWLTLFFVVIQLALVLLISIRLYKKDTRK